MATEEIGITKKANYKNIADAIRSRGETSELLKPNEMAPAILSIPHDAQTNELFYKLLKNGAIKTSDFTSDIFTKVISTEPEYYVQLRAGAFEHTNITEFNFPDINPINYIPEGNWTKVTTQFCDNCFNTALTNTTNLDLVTNVSPSTFRFDSGCFANNTKLQRVKITGRNDGRYSLYLFDGVSKYGLYGTKGQPIFDGCSALEFVELHLLNPDEISIMTTDTNGAGEVETKPIKLQAYKNDLVTPLDSIKKIGVYSPDKFNESPLWANYKGRFVNYNTDPDFA